MIAEGSFVHSLDLRDDAEMFYVVVETGIHTSSGFAHKIALPEQPEVGFYRLVNLLVPADAEIAREVAEAKRLAPNA